MGVTQSTGLFSIRDVLPGVKCEKVVCWVSSVDRADRVVEVAKSFAAEGVGDEVLLHFTGQDAVPADVSVILIDRDLDRVVDFKAVDTYRFFCGERDFIQDEAAARFRLMAGHEEWLARQTEDLPGLPVRAALFQNRPNPFNPATVIRYELARPGPASLQIYDLSGRLVTVLFHENREAGRYEVVWRGEDSNGRKVSSGVYFYRLQAGSFVETRRMTLIR